MPLCEWPRSYFLNFLMDILNSTQLIHNANLDLCILQLPCSILMCSETKEFCLKKMKPCCVLGECNVGDYLGHNYVLVDSVCFILWLLTVNSYCEMLMNYWAYLLLLCSSAQTKKKKTQKKQKTDIEQKNHKFEALLASASTVIS